MTVFIFDRLYYLKLETIRVQHVQLLDKLPDIRGLLDLKK